MTTPTAPIKDHFHGQTALRHIAEVQALEFQLLREVHGAEAPGPVFAFSGCFS